jgi:hypothetical protein
MKSSDFAAVFRRLADEIEKMDDPALEAPVAPPAPAPPATMSAQLGEVKELARQVSGLETLIKPPPPAPEVPSTPKPVINLDTIKGIQQAFNSIRAPNYAKLEENGIHDAVMTWALKEFQATAGIPATGEADKTTIDTLHKIIFGAART